MGVDRIMFSAEYPFVENQPAVDWPNNSTSAAKTEKIS
jgi:hypothetical protein